MTEPQGYNELKAGAAKVAWPNLSRFLFKGADALEWLQGQVTNDLRQLAASHPVACCLTKPTGQFLERLSVFQTEHGLEVVSEGRVILSRAESFVVMEDVEVFELPKPTVVLGPRAVGDIGPWNLGVLKGALASTTPDLPEASLDAVSLVTLENATSVTLWDADDKTLPPELGEGFVKEHVSYDKGCYVGQEVLQRIHSRGHVNKAWVVLSTQAPAEIGETVMAEGSQGAGHVTRSALSPTKGFLVGAMVRTSAMPRLFVAGKLATVLD